MLDFRPIEDKDFDKLLELDLREADKKEIKALTGEEPWKAIKETIVQSNIVFTIEEAGEPVGLYALAIEKHGANIVALLGNDRLNNYPVQLVRHLKQVADNWNQYYGCLFNFIDARRSQDFKFLRTLGFNILDQKKFYFDDEDHPFYFFYRR